MRPSSPKPAPLPNGVDRFFSSIYGAPVPGLAFFALSLVSVDERRAFPMSAGHPHARRQSCEQRQGGRPAPTAERRRPGCPKGSRTQPKTDRPLSPELQRIGTMIGTLQQRIAPVVSVTYLLLDGYFGHAAALQMARAQNLQLISKLRTDAALYTPYAEPYAGRGSAPDLWGQTGLSHPAAGGDSDHDGARVRNHPDL